MVSTSTIFGFNLKATSQTSLELSALECHFVSSRMPHRQAPQIELPKQPLGRAEIRRENEGEGGSERAGQERGGWRCFFVTVRLR